MEVLRPCKGKKKSNNINIILNLRLPFLPFSALLRFKGINYLDIFGWNYFICIQMYMYVLFMLIFLKFVMRSYYGSFHIYLPPPSPSLYCPKKKTPRVFISIFILLYPTIFLNLNRDSLLAVFVNATPY